MSDRPTKTLKVNDVQAIGATDRRVPEPEGLLTAGVRTVGETASTQLYARIQSMGRVNRRVPAPTGKAARHSEEVTGLSVEADAPSIFKI